MRAAAQGLMAVALLLAACGGPDRATRELERLRAAIGDNPAQHAEAPATAEGEALDRLTSELEGRAGRAEKAILDWQLGECHRLRDILGREGAWENAERRLQLALARDPSLIRAHVSLGQLYLRGGMGFAARAEREFSRALEKSGGARREARKGLFFAYYYQGRFAEALREADRYLALGEDADFVKFRAMAEANAARASKEKK